MTALRLIDGEGQGAHGGRAAMQLDVRSRRPGVAHEEIELHCIGAAAAAACAGAAYDRLPVPLWSLIAIESERALQAAAPDDPARSKLAARLDWVARMPPPDVPRETRLHAWAVALRCPPDSLCYGSPTPEVTLELIVPYHTLLAWELAANRVGLPLTEWACISIAGAGLGRRLWEAAAAEAGCTLGEWIALSALTDLRAVISEASGCRLA